MQVFISWSGAISGSVGQALRDWLPQVIHAVEPYISSEDIAKGERWGADLANHLEATDLGIICVTPENVGSPWLNFEAGALSKVVGVARVIPLLFRMKATEVAGPLAQFQASTADRGGVLAMMRSVNECLGAAALDKNRLEKSFEAFWPQLKDRLGKVKAPAVGPGPGGSSRPEVDMIEEILMLTRTQHRILSSPEDLLPVSYLSQILEGDPALAPAVVDDLSRAWIALGQAADEIEVRGSEPEAVAELAMRIQRLGRPLEHVIGRLNPLRSTPRTLRPPGTPSVADAGDGQEGESNG